MSDSVYLSYRFSRHPQSRFEMNLNSIKRFAQEMRCDFMAQVGLRLDFVLSHDDEYLRAHAQEKRRIIELERSKGRDSLVEEAAYLWFNRIAAFRYMDARGYTAPRIVSPRSGDSQPELLSEIKAGRAPAELGALTARFDALLSGRIRSPQPDREVYKEALLGACNAWADAMPWLFAKVEDWAGLLLPQDILSPDSLVARMVKGLSDEDCSQGVEIIGWLYQFYISEKKDEVFAALKKNVKITKENIPAATQLFTPHWIVRFMVENSLGRLWLLNRPESRIKERMKYFVESDPEPEFLKLKDPTELKCLDPCCGSGHILAYFFELLYAIYEEEGYAPQEIPSLILKKNIYGIDIDERAAELAAFTLAMVAREKDKRFFERGVVPNVIAMRDIDVDLRKVHTRLSPDLQVSLELLKEGRNYGSLIPVPEGAGMEIAEVEAAIQCHRYDELFGSAERDALVAAFRILEYLEPRYHVVVTNPPYMGSNGMNLALKNFITSYYPENKGDLFSAFIFRCIGLALNKACLGFMTPFVWMFISSYEQLRSEILEQHTLTSLVQLEYSGFVGATVPICTFAVRKGFISGYRGGYIRLSSFRGAENQAIKTEEAIKNCNCNWFYRVSQKNYLCIPGKPVVYWLHKPEIFAGERIGDLLKSGGRLKTHNNELFIRKHWEVGSKCINSREFVFIENGGDFRKWYGNKLDIVDLRPAAKANYESHGGMPSPSYWGKPAITWGMITSAKSSYRYKGNNSTYSSGAPTIFPFKREILGFLNSKVTDYLMTLLNPTLNTPVGEVNKLPIIIKEDRGISNFVSSSIHLEKADWDLHETSWDFLRSPLLTNFNANYKEKIIDENLVEWSWPSTNLQTEVIELIEQAKSFKSRWTTLFLELHKKEEENNRAFIDLYGLQDELTPDVPYSEITILQDELVESARKEGRIEFDESVLARQFVSYGAGCLVGRYSAEKDGLILADAAATLEDFLAKVPDAHFLPDLDGILPLTDEDDFVDDLPTRFKAWLRFISGDLFEDNLRWIEERLGNDLRTYFIRDFY